MRGRSRTAGAAQPLVLDGCYADAESCLSRSLGQNLRNIMVLHLPHPPALAADQELRRMRRALPIGINRTSRDTADKGRQSLHPMNQPLLQQELECPVDRG